MNFNKIVIGIVYSFFISKIVLAQESHSDHEHFKKKEHVESINNKPKKAVKHDHAEHKEHKEEVENKDDDKHNHLKHDNLAPHKNEDKHEHDEHESENKDGHAGHSEGEGKAIGKGKAIVAVDKVKGIKLSKEAFKTLEIKLQTVESSNFKISKNVLVTSKSDTGIYRFRNGYFKFLNAKILKEEKGLYQISVKGVNQGDQIVINGIGLLRITDIYSTDQSEYGHSH